jgi:hypothetical protein
MCAPTVAGEEQHKHNHFEDELQGAVAVSRDEAGQRGIWLLKLG